jgi:hypothetical protein
MSALGHKPTCAVQKGMSALPPKADMCGATRDVRYGPIADIQDTNREANLRRVPSSLRSSDGSRILSNLGSRCSGHAQRLIIPLSVVRTRLNTQGIQKSLCHLRIIEVACYTMTIVS